MVKVVDQLLPELFFRRLENILNNTDNNETRYNKFNWFWNNQTASDRYRKPLDNNFMFTHMLWDADLGATSEWYLHFEPILYFLSQHIKVEKIIRMKLNLYTNQNKRIDHAKHHDVTDLEDDFKPVDNVNISVLNFTTCNGGTVIGDKEYLSIKNQGIIFSNKLIHNGFLQTDTPRRIMLNIATI